MAAKKGAAKKASGNRASGASGGSSQDAQTEGLMPTSGTGSKIAVRGTKAPKGRSGRIMNLPGAFIFNGITYGPGKTTVPEDFPDLTEEGEVIHESGSVAERNARMSAIEAGRAESAVTVGNGGKTASKSNKGGSRSVIEEDEGDEEGEPYTRAELEDMDKEELISLAESSGIEVSRQDGGDGEPTKADYVAALSGE